MLAYMSNVTVCSFATRVDAAWLEAREEPHPDALTIFDYKALVTQGHVTYAGHRLDVEEDFPKLIAEARQFLKDVVADS
jgi:hypothetical protein